jgi:hypothetical protein
MKRVLFTAAALVALTVTANASIIGNYECGAAKSSPPDADIDPIYKTELETINAGQDFPLRGFSIKHYATSGRVYAREDQYRDRRFWSSDAADNWSGVSVKSPGLTMVGTLMEARRNRLTRLSYVEKIFRNGRLETTIVSVCHPVEVER